MRLVSIKKTFCTRWLISLCVLLFIWNFVDRYQWISAHKSEEQQVDAHQIPLMPLEKALLYDDPDLTSTRGIWQGYYAQLFPKKEATAPLAPLTFGKIAQGEVWRLETPAFLHGGVLHILFNMLWLWILGKQVEEKIGAIRYLLMILLLGVLSNTAQYLMSGFSFVGFSGIICGLAGYIWIRQRTAPWEGYALQRGTLGFLMVFVLGIAALQCLTFGLQYFQVANIQLPVANTAHLVGALSGIILARIPGFSK
jgi:GlpG protein